MDQQLLDKIEAYRAKGFEVPDEDMIKTPEQIEGIRKACEINTKVLDEVAKHIKAGMTTADIDKIVYDFTTAQGAVPAPLGFCGFPKSVCTSINDQVCHGIPSENDVLKSGDIVNVDVSTIYNGYYADASRMFMIGKVNPKAEKLVNIAKECLKRGVEAAKACGAKDGTIIFKHIIPNSLAPVIVRVTMGMGSAVLSTSSLSYLGIGVEAHIPEWGNILKAGSKFLETNPYIAIFPGIAIIIIVLSFNFFGDGLRDALDPKLK